MSLSASEHVLKRFHGHPRARVTHLNIVFSTGNWREPRCCDPGVQYKVYLVSRNNSILCYGLWRRRNKICAYLASGFN